MKVRRTSDLLSNVLNNFSPQHSKRDAPSSAPTCREVPAASFLPSADGAAACLHSAL